MTARSAALLPPAQLAHSCHPPTLATSPPPLTMQGKKYRFAYHLVLFPQFIVIVGVARSQASTCSLPAPPPPPCRPAQRCPRPPPLRPQGIANLVLAGQCLQAIYDLYCTDPDSCTVRNSIWQVSWRRRRLLTPAAAAC